MIPAKIVKGLVDVAIEIGRWILEKIARRTIQWLIHYMEGRVEVFGERLARARTKRRKAWLTGRIGRWQRAIRWLRNNLAALSKTAVRTYCAATNEVISRIPRIAAGERYGRAA